MSLGVDTAEETDSNLRMFTPVPTRLEDIFNSPTQFAIPLYQREYKWGKEEASDLLEDLDSYTGTPGEQLFLGNLIFEKSREGKTFVVDGQQRLTTIMLLLIACRMQARKLGMSTVEQLIQEKITFMNSRTGESLGSRLIASESIREIFEYMTNSLWDGNFPKTIAKKSVKRKVNKIKPIYDSFVNTVSTFDADQLSNFLGAVYDSYVARIEVESEVEALSIFERTNARGLDLEISDLLKNYLFTKKVEGLEESWTKIVESAGGTIPRMLKYFYISKKEYVLKPQLYKKLKAFAAKVGPSEFTSELSAFSDFYRIVKSPEQKAVQEFFHEREIIDIGGHSHRFQAITRSLEALREFGVVQFCPPAYAAIECMKRSNLPGDAKKLIGLFDAFEKYHFINNMICERVGNEVERLYADSCESYGSDEAHFVQETDKLIQALKTKLASEDEFVARFVELSYATDPVSLLHYIFDRLNNFGRDPIQCVQIFNPDPKLKTRNHNIEHFLSQKPEVDQKPDKAAMDMVDNIGNLLSIYFKDNSRLQNVSPAQKISLLEGTLAPKVENLQLVKEFIRQYGAQATHWGAESIRGRAKDMAREAYTKIWKIK